MRITRLAYVGTLCVSAGFAAWACSDDTTGGTAAPDGGPIGPDSGGAETSVPQYDGGVDSGPLWCGAGDGGVQSRCSKYQWDDFVPDAAPDAPGPPNCKACPGRALTCADLVRRVDGGGTTLLSPRYDPYQTKTFTVDVPPGVAEIVGGAVTVAHTVCYGSPQFDASTATVQAEIHGNEINAPLASSLDGGNYDGPCGEITYQLVDSCCTTSTVKFESYYDPESNLYKTSCPDGG